MGAWRVGWEAGGRCWERSGVSNKSAAGRHRHLHLLLRTTSVHARHSRTVDWHSHASCDWPGERCTRETARRSREGAGRTFCAGRQQVTIC